VINRKVGTGGYSYLATIPAGTPQVLTYVDSPTGAGSYTYQVAAVATNSAGSTTSTTPKTLFSAVTVAVPAAPAKPASLTATVSSATSVGLNWGASTTAGASYIIQRHTLTTPSAWGVYATLTTVAAGATSYTDNTVVAGNGYQYTIAAVATNAIGTSPSTYQASLTDNTGLSGLTAVAGAAGTKNLTVSWTAVPGDANVTGFKLQRRNSTNTTYPATWTDVVTIPATTASSYTYVDGALLTTNNYEYQVIENGASGAYATAAMTTGVKPK
jgi:hypothetical protein